MKDEEIRLIFAKNLNHYLKLNGLSQADLARYMKVSTATATKWCNAQSIPRIDKIQSLCNWFVIEKSDLLEEHKTIAKREYTPNEIELIEAYRNAEMGIRNSVRILLGLKSTSARKKTS